MGSQDVTIVSPETYSERQIAQLFGTDLSSSSSKALFLSSAELSILVELLVWLLFDGSDSTKERWERFDDDANKVILAVEVVVSLVLVLLLILRLGRYKNAGASPVYKGEDERDGGGGVNSRTISPSSSIISGDTGRS
mmetsp:Transcript_17865/g.29261  ORF Transcript_17865/g.29261 Transcript_17865/m.29261 type:complete len:138 (-) Transcript_17865:1411-1824(-)